MLRSLTLIAALCIGFAAPAPAGAQSAVDDVIIVTETGAPRSTKELAGAVSRLDAETLTRIAATHPAEALNRQAGVYIHRNTGREHLTAIRSPVLTGGAGAGSFLYLENGVPLRAAGFANVNGLFEAQTELAAAIEVTPGPGGPIYGSNALHGVINVLARHPGDNPGLIEVAGGSFDRLRARGALTSQTGKGAITLGAALFREGEFREDTSVNEQKLQMAHTRPLGPGALTTIASFTNLNQESAGFIRGPDAYRDRALTQTNADPDAFRDARSARIAATYAQALGEAHLTVTPFARWTDQDFILFFLPSKADEASGHQSVGAQTRLRWEGRTRVIVGVDIDLTRGFLTEVQRQDVGIPAFPVGVHYDFTVDAATLATYGRWERDLGPWRAAFGARYETVNYQYDTDAAPGAEGRFFRPEDRTDRFDSVVGKASLVRAIGDQASVYGQVSRGARAPQVFEVYRLQPGQDPELVDVETLDAGEIGARLATPRGGRLAMAGFVMRKSNVFFRDADGFNVTGAATRHEGVEASLDQPITDAITLSASATYARHTYDFNRTLNNASESIAKGDDVDTAPRTLASVRALWAPTARIEAELEWLHVGRYFTNAANTERYPGHDLVHVRFAATPDIGDGATTLFASARNVMNVDYAERADFAFGSERYLPGRGRVWEIGVRRTF